MSAITDYLRAVRETYRGGSATEHSYRAALAALLNEIGSGTLATNEPKHRSDCGAPDMKVADGSGPEALTIGYLECKNIGVPLDDAEKSEQLDRYRDNLDNLILTDYLEFRWYVEGRERMRATLAHVADGKIVTQSGGAEALADLLGEFLAHTPEPITSPRELAQRMAKITGMIREIIIIEFNEGDRSGATWGLYEAFRETLLPNIKPGEFADMFAQTLAYGLFAARVNHPAGEPFDRYRASREIPRTNPFLRDLFETITGNALDREPYVGFVDDLTRVLAHADIGAVLADFGASTRQEDPIVHFYETFLAAYDPKLREMRGVYYTPEPVVSYIVRSVDWILKEHFGLSGGLANEETVTYEVTLPDGSTEQRESPKVLILDPACGTGTFLYHVIEHIRQQFVQSNNAGKWPGFVARQLLPRLFGFELLMAPYAVAHLKLGMQLAAQDMTEEQREKWAYDFEDDQRLGVYLTNTLEEAEQTGQRQFGIMQTITDEANAAAEVKRDMPIMVVLGNPPYAKHSSNKGPWIDGLLKGELPSGESVTSYYHVRGESIGEANPKWLQDDYVKFIRFAQWRLSDTKAGVLAFITNNGYLDNPTFRGMRQSLLDDFTDIYILNLHGASIVGELAPDGAPDENVFDIRTGVAISVMVRDPEAAGGLADVHYADIWGARGDKYARLRSEDCRLTEWREANPSPPHYLMVPSDASLGAEFHNYVAVPEAVPTHSTGIASGRDDLCVQTSADEVWAVVNDFVSLPTEEAREAYELGTDARDWKVHFAQNDLRDSGPVRSRVVPILYRPFDGRYTYYTGNSRGFICMPRSATMRHVAMHENLSLLWTRPGASRDGLCAFCAQGMIDQCAAGNKSADAGSSYLGPLYLYPDPEKLDDLGDVPWPEGEEGRKPNLSKDFVDEFAGKLGLEFVSDGRGDLQAAFGPEDIFDYIYAVFHSPTYRERYAEFLKIDFPRVPLTSDADLFRDLVDLGGELVQLHLMEHTALAQEADRISYPQPGDNEVESGHPKYFPPGEGAPGESEPLERGRVYINGTKRKADAPDAQYFEGIAPAVWEFQVGGYQVLDKWLKDRKGRRLDHDDLTHYQQIVVALERTMALMARIDERIEEWPIE